MTMKALLRQNTMDSTPIIAPDSEQLKEITAILESPPEERSLTDLGKLSTILKEIEFFNNFFKKMPSETCETLLRQLQYEYVSRDDSVKRFYLVLKGSVFVMVPQKVENKDNTTSLSQNSISPLVALALGIKVPSNTEREEDSQLKFQNKLRRALSRNLNKKEPLEVEELLRKHPNHYVLCTLKEGEHFGDAALRLDNFKVIIFKRAASAICRESSHFMTLSPNIYRQLIEDYQERLQQEVIDYFANVPLTKGWSSENIMTLVYQANVQKLKRNHVIYDIGDPCDFIYFIKHGEVEIVKELHLKVASDEAGNRASQPRNSFSLNKSKLLHMNAIWKRQYSEANTQRVRIAKLGPNQSFGEEELSGLAGLRHTRAMVTSSTAEIIIVSHKKFIENRNNPRKLCKKLLSIDGSAKKEWRKDFEHQLVEMSIPNNGSLEKTRSKFDQEFADCIPLLVSRPGDFREKNPTLEALRRSDGFPKKTHPRMQAHIPPKKSRVSTTVNDAKSASPFNFRKDTPIVEKTLSSSPTLSKKGHISSIIDKEATEVRVMFRNNNALTIDPEMTSVCLDLSPQSFIGTRILQTCQASHSCAKNLDNSMLKFSEPSSPINSLSAKPALIRLNSLEQRVGIGRSPNLSRLGSEPLVTLPQTTEEEEQEALETLPDVRFNKKLGQILGSRLKGSGKLSNVSAEPNYCSMSISAMLTDKDYIKSRDSLKYTLPVETSIIKRRNISNLPTEKNKVKDQSYVYISGSFLPQSLPKKHSIA